ncbi:MAG: hypothetical protein WDO13_03980 [Verrucomicrobiota bacterium]
MAVHRRPVLPLPPAAVVLARYARWQSAGGALGNGVAAALAGGLLSEVSLVYFQGKGRWTAARLESLAFKGAVFFVAGCIVFEFYRLQAWLWGQGVSLSVLVRRSSSTSSATLLSLPPPTMRCSPAGTRCAIPAGGSGASSTAISSPSGCCPCWS